MSEYLIHWNGGRPFIVRVDGLRVEVYLTENKPDYEAGEHLRTFQAKRVWVPKGEAYRFSSSESDNYPPDIHMIPWKGAEGNTILLEDADGSYVHIGNRISRFHPKEPIAEFRSPVGNSNVPYPFATTANYTYTLGGGGKFAPRPLTRVPHKDDSHVWSSVNDKGTAYESEELARRW